MNILLINKFHYRRGGAETYYFDLGELLEAAGHEVHYFSMEDKENIPCADERYFVKHKEYVQAKSVIEKVKGFCNTAYSLDAKRQLSKMIAEIRPDIIHVNNYHRQLSCSIFDAAMKCRVPVVMTAHDATCVCPQIYMNYSEACTRCSNGKYYNCLRRRCIKQSLTMSFAGMVEGYISKFDNIYGKIAQLIVPSAYIADIYRKDGFPADKIKVIHNSKTIKKLKPSGWPNRVYGIFVGRLSKEKGVLTLLQAMSRVQNVKLKIVGTGPEEDAIYRFIVDHQLENRVEMVGFQTGQTLEDIISGARFAVVASQTPENCPYGVIEAMSHGVPVIGTDLGGTPELIDDGINGWICEAGDVNAMAAVLGKAWDQAPALYDAAYAKALDCYSTEYYYEQIIGVYRSVVENYRG